MKFTAALFALVASATLPCASAQDSIVDIALGDPDFSTLVAALNATDLVDALSGDGPFTVFAPTNAAFADDVGQETLDLLLTDEWKAHLTGILLYHVVEGNVTSDMLALGPVTTLLEDLPYTLLEGSDLEVTSLDPPEINGFEVSTPDIVASNGIIHVMDDVLLPPFMLSDIVDTAINANFSTLVDLVSEAGLVDALQGPGLTVFAPTNEAFEALGQNTTDSLLLPENRQMLIDILSYHVVPQIVLSDQLVDGAMVDTLLENATLAVSTNPAQVNGVDIVTADILTSNGVIHVVDQVLLPGVDGGDMSGGDGDDMSGGDGGDMSGGDGGDTSGSRAVSVLAGAAALVLAIML